MFELVTERLRVIPLTLEALDLCRKGRHFMEARLGLATTFAPADYETQKAVAEALEIMIELVSEDRKHYLWNTNWEIVLRGENRIIGALCFQGPPDSMGDVQVGYVLQPAYREKGYMAEALGRALQWALSCDEVEAVIAETDKNNVPSCRLLSRLGMIPWRETESTIWWSTKRQERGRGERKREK